MKLILHFTHFRRRRCLGLALLALLSTSLSGQPTRDVYQLVDPRIGTDHDGQTYPAVGMPFGMTGWTPETQSTESKCLSPYYYKAEFLTGFRDSHWLSGSCTQDYGSVTLMPVVGELRVTPQSRAAHFSHASEVMSPAYHSVDLPDKHTRVELTGTVRTGMMRISFPRGNARHLVIDANVHPGKGYVAVRPAEHEIVGYNSVVRIYQGAGQSARFSGYSVMRFREDMIDHGTSCGENIRSHIAMQSGGCRCLGAYASFSDRNPTEVVVKIGTSFTSIDEAERNLDNENPGWDFATIRERTETAWRTLLNRVEVEHHRLSALHKNCYPPGEWT